MRLRFEALPEHTVRDPETEIREQAPWRLHHSFARTLGPQIHIAVVGVADERVSAFLQLLVHLVQKHIRQ
jgi:hypothetical protein